MSTVTKTTQHTPGPWEAKQENNYVPAQVWADGRQLAEVYGETLAIRQVNARLMAASLEMLAALEEVDAACKSGDWENAIAMSKAAIRAAKGEDQ